MNKPHLRYKKQTAKERDVTIRVIAVLKFLKGLILLIVGVKLLTLIDQDIAARMSAFVDRHGIDAENRFVHAVMEKFSGVDRTQLMAMGSGALLYSSLMLTEGVGLWLEKRWAEYLATVATALFIPLELYELYERFTWVRIIILFVNLFVVWYLATRLRDEKKETSEKLTEEILEMNENDEG